MGKGDDVTDTRPVSAECTFEDIQASDGIGNRCASRSGGGELRDDIKPLGVNQVQWHVGDLHIPDWGEDQPDLGNSISWKGISEARRVGLIRTLTIQPDVIRK